MLEHELVGMMIIREEDDIIHFQGYEPNGTKTGAWETHKVEGESPVETVQRLSKLDDYIFDHYKTIYYDIYQKLN